MNSFNHLAFKAWTNIDFFNVNSSTLRSIAPNAFSNSQIQTVEFYQANAISVGQLFEVAREVRIENRYTYKDLIVTSSPSFVHEVRGLENVTNLCLRNNSINCRCMLIGSSPVSLVGSICDDPLVSSTLNNQLTNDLGAVHRTKRRRRLRIRVHYSAR